MSQPLSSSPGKVSLSAERRSPTRPRTAVSYLGLPPSSPPPTLPLPPPPISPSPKRSLGRGTPPPRPPRPQESLPELRPYKTLSPQISRDPGRHAARVLDTSSRLQSALGSPVSFVSRPATAAPPSSRFVTPINHRYYSRGHVAHENAVHAGPNGRTWWGRAPADTTPPYSNMAEWPLVTPLTLPRPMVKTKRRTKRPPRKAIARSALYIPSTSTLAIPPPPPHRHLDGKSLNATARSRALLYHDDMVTSLPPWSSPGILAVNDEGLDISWESKGKARAVEAPPAIRNLSTLVEHRPRTPEEYIAFRAVTHLGDVHPEKPVTRAAPNRQKSHRRSHRDHGRSRAWHRRYRQHLWAVVTILCVLLGTGGVVTGIVWKLIN